MDKEKMVNRLKEILHELSETEGDLALAMLVYEQPNDINSRFMLLLSATWLDKMSPKIAIQKIAKKIREQMDSTDFVYITRIVITKTSDRVVQAINSAFKVSNSIIDLANCNVFGLQIDKAIIFESNKTNS